MMTEKQRIDLLLELQENSERFTDQELQKIFEDNKLRLLMEQLAFAKRAFITQEAAPSVDAEWDNFANKYADELSRLDQKHMKIAFTTLLRRIAAVVVGIVLLSGIAFATAHYIKNFINNNQENCTETNPIDISQKQSFQAEKDAEIPVTKRIFDNVPLEEILAEIAVAYNTEVEFQDDAKRSLRLHFVWKSEDNLIRVVEKLNTFNTINITIKNNKIIVK